MKMEVVIVFLLSLLMIFLAFRKDLPWLYLIALIAIIGFNPYFWRFKDNIVSDLPFLLFVYLSLFLIHRAYQSNRAGGPQIFDASLISISIYLAYGTRSIGLVLLLCLLVYDLIKHKRPTVFAIKTAALAGMLIVLQNVFLHSDSSYASHIGVSLSAAMRHTWEYASELSAVWAGGGDKVSRLALFAAMSGLAVVGYLTRIKGQITFFEIFLVLYLIPLLVLPIPVDVRFLMPVMPLYLFYAFLGIRAVPWHRGREGLAFLLVTAVFLVAYATQYAKVDYGPIREGIAKSETQQLFEYVKKETGEGDVFIFRKPRALVLFTGRSASVWHQPPNDQELWDYFRRIKATYLVLGPSSLEPDDQAFLRRFVEKYQDHLQETYTNADFQVYRIK
jgi:hypothetical protein